ncbi:hypothetical protein GJ496_000149 [Pomphorhynchus laevis]|nr:hypothetical protein GJ496_000149 [Pomphorhynchus laevis]
MSSNCRNLTTVLPPHCHPPTTSDQQYKQPHNDNAYECDDCGMVGAIWAAISHGTTLCDECASAHRNLGRHVSQVRCLKAGITWPSSLLHMFTEMSLNRQANRILEFELIVSKDSKPCAFDDYETKFSFIRQKYELLAFVKRLNNTGIYHSNQHQQILNSQLRRAVQVNDIMSTFWLLLSGSNPNWRETQELTSTALCDSAAFGRKSILELLCIWGGDLSSADLQYIATSNGHIELAERIGDLEVELVNRIMEYVKRRHQRIDLLDCQSSGAAAVSGLNRSGRTELQQLPETSFAELLKDIYDEIERRDTNQLFTLLADWKCRSNESLGRQNYEKLIVPFLPVIPHLSATRNQGRQKLARFSTIDFYLFMIDVAANIKRRKYGIKTQLLIKRQSQTEQPQNCYNTDECIYDQVASENDDSDSLMSKELKLRVMRLESQLKQLTCVNEELRHQMSDLRTELLKNLNSSPDRLEIETKMDTGISTTVEERRNYASRISQNLESDYDNMAMFSGFEVRDESVTGYGKSSPAVDTTLIKINRVQQLSIKEEPEYSNALDISVTENNLSIEDSIMKVIKRIGELHELIKKKQRNDYEKTSLRVVHAVRELCVCADQVSRTVNHLVTDLDVHASKLLSISGSASHQLVSHCSQVEHAIIDCCYQIGFCTKSIVSVLSSASDKTNDFKLRKPNSSDTLL